MHVGGGCANGTVEISVAERLEKHFPAGLTFVPPTAIPCLSHPDFVHPGW